MNGVTHRVVVLGGGFGGLLAARHLEGAPAEVTLIDRRNFHLFQPLLYQVATGALSPANIAAPLRDVLQSPNTSVILAEAQGVDLNRREVLLDPGSVPYDTLVVALGSQSHYFGHDEWETFAPGLKTIEDATRLRREILAAFEQAERSDQEARRQELLTFVIVGGGPTGVEMAGAIAELAHFTLKGEFRRIDPAAATIVLIEAESRVLATYHETLSQKAAAKLRELGVTVRTGVRVNRVAKKRFI